MPSGPSFGFGGSACFEADSLAFVPLASGFSISPCWAVAVCLLARPAPRRTVPSTTSSATFLSLFRNMVFRTPSAKTATLAGIALAVAVCPAATRATAFMMDDTTAGGTPADTVVCDNPAAKVPPDTNSPSRASRLASIVLARASRLATVPMGTPSCPATSLRGLPSNSHSTMAARYLSGRRLNS